jgi:hypothetical protein
VQNLLYIVRVKVLSQRAQIDSISQEEGQLLLRGPVLDRVDHAAVQERLTGQGVPARVGRRSVWLALREDGGWQRDLVRTLEAIR